MKRILLAMLVFSAIVSSCKKDKVSVKDKAGIKHKIQFRVAGFSQTFEPMGTQPRKGKAIKSISDKVSAICYLIYDDENKLLSYTRQLPTDAGYGTFDGNLSEGTYTVAIAAGDRVSVVEPEEFNDAFFCRVYIDDPRYPQYYLDEDTFFKKMTLVVNASTPDVQPVTLERVVGNLQVNVADQIPEDADRVVVQLDTVVQRYFIDKGVEIERIPRNDDGEVDSEYEPKKFSRSVTLTSAQKGTSNVIVGSLFTPTLNNMKATITIYQGTNILAKKVVNNVTCQPNKITLLTGNMFITPGAGVAADFKQIIKPLNK